MAKPNSINVVADTFGLLCPMPIIKAGESIKQMVDNEVLEVIATDPGAVQDLKDWCKANRHEYLGDERNDKVYRIWIKKGMAGAKQA